jgi:hypothetical protein
MGNNSWFYQNGLIRLSATPWPMPVCGNGVCENEEDDVNCFADCPVGLIGYWKFDEPSGSVAADSSGFGNNGTVYGASFVSGRTNNALSFDGVNDYASIGKFGSFQRGFTIEFWFYVKPSSIVQRPYLSNVFSTCYIDTGYIGNFNMPCYIGDGNGWSGSIWTDGWPFNAWTHFAMTYNTSSGSRSIYRNGVAVGSGTYDRMMIMSSDMTVGTGWGSYFNGTIDEFAIFNRALTPQEVYDHYQNRMVA